MAAANEDSLSSDELRKKLFNHFKSKGVLDMLKAQLRSHVIRELKHPLVEGLEPVPGARASSRSNSLLVTATNTIVADYLQTSGYEYSLSVFSPECGLRKDQMSNQGFLTSLMTHLADVRGHTSHSDADTQTISHGSYRESLVDKMKVIDQEYESLHPRGNNWMSHESKLTAYKRQLETQMHAEINIKMQHFKDVELAKMRMEEKAKSNKEFGNFRQDLERTYEMKMDESNVYLQRQTLLKEIEKVRNSENELKLRMAGFEKTCELHTDKVKALEELLRRRELTVRTSEDAYEQKLHTELSRYKLELKEEFIKRTEQLTENENRNKVETARTAKESSDLEAKIEVHITACGELRRVQGALESSEQRVSLLGQQKELLSERLEAVADYSALKRETVELQAQLSLVRRQLEEAQEESRLLRADAARPSAEQLALQTELQRLQGAHRLQQEQFDNQRQVLQAQLQGEVERCAHLNARLMECEEKSHRLTTHAEELKMQLRQTQQALENEVLRHPISSLVDRSVLKHSADRPEPEENDLLARAKARFRQLEREAETLEEAYRRPGPLPRPYSPPPVPRAHTAASPPGRPPDPLPGPLDPSPDPWSRATSLNPPPAEDTALRSFADPASATRSGEPRAAPLSPSGRLSSPLLSPSTQPQPRHTEEVIAFPELSPEEGLSPTPLGDRTPSSVGSFSPDLGHPREPRLRSTARDESSPQQLSHPAFSSSESSPQPEEIHLDDLSTTLPGPGGDIPELLLDTAAVPLPPQAPGRAAVPPSPAPQDLPDAPLLERGPGEKEGVDEQEESIGAGTKSPGENPLESYMKMVLEAKQHTQSPVRAEPEAASPDPASPDPRSLSDERDHSIAAYSQEAADDDFW
ncbi:hypothetical protein NHX12_007531 [Muraenolepis orangiensis]|uniref:LisH domain-containing protein n=1 Tax=Muraenolepis orangiensis TaxID=630683 RepID=A0A9Q0IBA1_9TELE|nr:hypothetical protein NHX12_007531 [Muraenolepis orangiensis]